MNNNKKSEGTKTWPTMTKINKEEFYHYLFHYNPYEDLWYAVHREDYIRYFNGDKKGIMKNKDFHDLTSDILIKFNPKCNDKTEA